METGKHRNTHTEKPGKINLDKLLREVREIERETNLMAGAGPDLTGPDVGTSSKPPRSGIWREFTKFRKASPS